MNKFIKLHIKCEHLDDEDLKLAELTGKEVSGDIFYKPTLFNLSHVASIEPLEGAKEALIVVPSSDGLGWVGMATEESYEEIEKLVL